MLKFMKILGIGETVLDKSMLIKGYAKEGSKTNASCELISLGGPVPTALILLARLGASCCLVSTVGKDSEGEVIKAILKSEQVKLITTPTPTSKVNLVLTNSENGSRTIIKSTAIHNKITNIAPQLIREADLILFDRHEPKAFDLVLKHKRPETKIIVDPSTEVSPNTIKMLEHSSMPIIPIEIYEEILTKLGPSKLVITAGGAGSYLLDKKEFKHVPSYKVKVADTLGAGDIYRGAFAFGVLKKWGVLRCVKFANLVSALHCTKTGNGTAIPTKKEILEFKKIASQNTETATLPSLKVVKESFV